MALQARARTRIARPINVDTETPVVPVYEVKAREFIRANKTKNEQAKIEKAAKDDVWKAMQQATPPIGSFSITEGNTTYDAVISGTTDTTIDVREIHSLLVAGTITLDQFLDTVSATQAKVKSVLGKNILAKVAKSSPGEAELTIKARKGEG